MSAPSTVPERLSNAVNYKVIAAIIMSVTLVHLFITYGPYSDSKDLNSSIFSMINPLVAGFLSVIVGFRYSMTRVFTRAYVCLGIGFLSAGVGEILYFLYDVVYGINPFPSLADVFFLAYYPFVMAHLVINIRFFKQSYSKKTILWLVLFPITYTASFFAFYQYDVGLETVISLAYIVPDSVTLALTIVAANLFRHGAIGAVWFILLIGLFFISAADYWYYHLEALDEYSLEHPVNVLWYAGYWIVTYALFKHRKVL